jgi:hypothetical protein
VSDILDRGLTPDQMRERLLRQDRAQWFAGEDPKHHHAIISRKGRVVARSESLNDRDFLLRAARAHDVLVDTLNEALDFVVAESDLRGTNDALYPIQAEALISQIGEALARAKGENPLVSTENGAGGRQS